MFLKRAVLAAVSALLAACASHPGPAISVSTAAALSEPVWAFERSDIPLDPQYRFGRLDNGMRYVIRANSTPDDTAIVRMEIATGSLDENEAERGYAHFVEHMAFNGSTNVPEGEMVRLLEREGLAFGADTNASTGFEETRYKLDLPRNDPALLDLALMLIRETASELTISPEAVAREKGVVLAEMRDRNTYKLRNAVDSMQFYHPGARYVDRLPIGTAEALSEATPESLRAFWSREYVAKHTTIVVIGDFDPDLVETKIRERFSDWQGSAPEPQPDAGPVDFKDGGRTAVYIDPALPERIEAARHGPWLNGIDTSARRKERLLRQIGYDIINRRFQRISRQPKPPFRGAGFGTGDVFEAGRSTRLIVDTSDRKWRRGLIAAATEYRRALKYGFTTAEVAEQLSEIRTRLENAAASADTRSHHALAGDVWSLLREGIVPSDPRTVIDRFEQFVPEISPPAVLAALKREALDLTNPLLRFRGRYEPEGGETAVRAAWNKAWSARIAKQSDQSLGQFAYAEFGTPGGIISDLLEPALGIRTVRFANGVMLNLKRTGLEKDRLRVKLSIDGGKKLQSRDNPFAVELVPYLAEGGLQKHSEDELQTILAGRTVNNEFRAEDDAITASVATTPRDLELQLQLLAAYVTDPGYREEGVERYRQDINRYFAQLNATPGSALNGAIEGIVSDGDPRFTLHEPEKYRALTYADLETGIADRLANGAIEIGIVGDIEDERAIALVAATFGALPDRETAFGKYLEQPARTFTADRNRRVIHHTGPQDQALLRLAWPTRDDSDPAATITLELLERVARIEMTETLRETLGKAYSPGASSMLSRHWPGYGTFSLTASVAVSEIPATEEAIRSTLLQLQSRPIDEDLLQRARQPMIESYQNALKTNAGWLSLVDRAQSEADRIDRYVKASDRLLAVSPEDLQAAARSYLDPDKALEILVLPEGIEPPS